MGAPVTTRMQKPAELRFDAQKVERLTTANESGRLEIQFSDAQGNTHVLSLPLAVAVALARLICDVAEQAPFLLGGKQASRARRK